MTGILYVVATPIGNLKDMTYRAVEVLNSVDLILAEDTRHATTLLKHYQIQKPLQSMHAFNEAKRLESIMMELQSGKTMALVSDAGTPLISDPGFPLVRAAKEAHITVIPVPGACAAITALSASGLPSDSFLFDGFLPVKREQKKQRLLALKSSAVTLIFYEAPHRLLDTLRMMVEVWGDLRQAVVARELTKWHESIIKNHLNGLLHHYESHEDQVKGEIVILVAGAEKTESEGESEHLDKLLLVLLEAVPLKQAVQMAQQLTDTRKNEIYTRAIELDRSRGSS